MRKFGAGKPNSDGRALDAEPYARIKTKALAYN
jgi:hypothetical protein